MKPRLLFATSFVAASIFTTPELLLPPLALTGTVIFATSAALPAQSITLQNISPWVLPAQSGTTPLVGNLQITFSIGQALPGQTYQQGNLMLTQQFQQPIKPLPPVAPPSQTACSDTPYTFTFSNIQAGKGTNQVQWALSSSFDSAHTISNGGTIVIAVDTNRIDTIWMRSWDSKQSLVSKAIEVIASVNSLPAYSSLPHLSSHLFCAGDSLTVTIPNTAIGTRYDFSLDSIIVRTIYGNGDTLDFSTIITNNDTVFSAILTYTSTGCKANLASSWPIFIQPVTANIYYYILGNHGTPDTVQFSTPSSCATNWVWKFPGAASVSDTTAQNPLAVYDSTGTYIAYLKAYNGTDTAQSQLQFNIYSSNYFVTLDSQAINVPVGSVQLVPVFISGGVPPYQIILRNSLDSQFIFTSDGRMGAFFATIDTTQSFTSVTVIDSVNDTTRAEGADRFIASVTCGTNLTIDADPFVPGDDADFMTGYTNADGTSDNEAPGEIAVYNPSTGSGQPNSTWFTASTLSSINALCVDLPTEANWTATEDESETTLIWAQAVTIDECTEYNFSFEYSSIPPPPSMQFKWVYWLIRPSAPHYPVASLYPNQNQQNSFALNTSQTGSSPQWEQVSGVWNNSTSLQGTYWLMIGVIPNGNGAFSASGGPAVCIDDITFTPVNDFACDVTPSQSITICSGKSATLNVSNDIPGTPTYQWSPSTGLSCTTCASPVANPTVTTTYTVTITGDGTNACGTEVATVTVNVSNCYCSGSSPTYTFNNPAGVSAAEVISQINGPGGSNIINPPPGTVIAFNTNLSITGAEFLEFKNCDILLGPGVEIDVQNGAVLTITNSYLHGCYEMWQGIKVETGGRLEITGGLPPTYDYSEIEDALYAVQLNPTSLFESSYTNYSNNFIGIYFDGLGTGIAEPTFVMLHSFRGNYFWGTRPLLEGFQTMNTGGSAVYHPSPDNNGNLPWAWAGVHAIRLQNLMFGVSGTNLTTRNYFDSVANGIITDACDLTVSNSTFEATHTFGYNLNYQDGGNDLLSGYAQLPFQGNGILCTNWNTKRLTPILNATHELMETGVGQSYMDPTFANCDHGIVTDRIDVNISLNYMSNNYGLSLLDRPVGIKVCMDKYGLTRVNSNTLNYLNSGMQFLQNDPVANLHVDANNITVTGNVGVPTGSGAGIEVAEGGVASLGLTNDEYEGNTVNASTNSFYGAYYINANGFYNYNNTINLQAPTNNFGGMAYDYCQSFTDQINTITGTLAGVNMPVPSSFAPYPAGVFYAACSAVPPNHTSHECNNISSVYTGMYFLGINNVNTFITGNKFNSSPLASSSSSKNYMMNDGLFVSVNASIANQLIAGNEWFGHDDGTSNDYTYSDFRVKEPVTGFAKFTTNHMQGTPYFPYSFEQSHPNIFGPPPIGSSPDDSSCTMGCPTCDQPYFTSLDSGMINGTANFDSSTYPAQMLWLNKDQLYRKIQAYPSLLDSMAGADSFYVAVMNAPMGQLASIDSIWRVAATPDSVTAAGWQAILNTVDSLTQLIPPIDSTLADTSTSSADSARLTAYEQSIYSIITGMDTTVDSAMLTYYNKKDSAAAIALGLNSAISPTDMIESNQVLYNQIYFSTMALDSATFDSTRIAQLLYLASQCPLTGGNSVYQARSLLALLVDTVFNDFALCSIPGDRALWIHPMVSDSIPADTLPKKLQVKMYPNPANDYTMLQLSEDVAPLQLQITGNLGQTVFNRPIATINGQYIINTVSYSSGLYYVALYSGNEKLFGDKLNIISK